MKAKWNNDNLKEYVENNSDCKYEGFYKIKSGHIMLKLIDNNNHQFEVQKKHFDNGKHCCNECNGITRWDNESLKKYISDNSKSRYIRHIVTRGINGSVINLVLKCQCGEEFKVTKHNFDKGCKQCRICSGFSKQKKITLAEYSPESLELWDYDKNGKITPYDITHASAKKYWFKCENGIHESELKIISDFSNGNRCSMCATNRVESIMATVLKIEFKNNFPNTIWEYRADYVGLKGKAYPYDIYVPELNLLIECQSEYHDSEYQKQKDKIKKDFALNNGYEFLEFDSRYNKLDDLLPILFGKEYDRKNYDIVNLNSLINWDLNLTQNLLNDTNMTYEEIGLIVGCSKNAIAQAIYQGTLKKPKDRKRKGCVGCKRNNSNSLIKTVYQICLDSKKVNKYNSIREAEDFTNIDNRNISSCCRGRINSCGNSKWLYEEDYIYMIENNIDIKDIRKYLKDKYLIKQKNLEVTN